MADGVLGPGREVGLYDLSLSALRSGRKCILGVLLGSLTVIGVCIFWYGC